MGAVLRPNIFRMGRVLKKDLIVALIVANLN